MHCLHYYNITLSQSGDRFSPDFRALPLAVSPPRTAFTFSNTTVFRYHYSNLGKHKATQTFTISKLG